MTLIPQSICALCKQERDLKLSHISPAFAIRWLKQSSATEYVRNPLNPNLPFQDAKKIRLLCGDCEQLFSNVEKIFAEKIFIPYHEQGIRTFRYDTWLQRFAISLVWRAIAKKHGGGFEDRPTLATNVKAAADCWAAFLLGRSKDPGPYDHHLIFWDPTTMAMTGETSGLPDHLMWYVLRAIDATTIMSDKTDVLYGYSKLPQMFFFSGINPKRPDGLQGTIIKKKERSGSIKSLGTSILSNSFRQGCENIERL